MADQITTVNGFLQEVLQCESVDEIASKVKQIVALKTALESVGKFRQNAVKYAILEAEALVRCVELGGASKLHGYVRKTAEWLYDLPPCERHEYIDMCKDGLTIDQVWKREVKDPQTRERNAERLNDMREWVIEDVKRDGIVDISHISAEARKICDPKHANDYIDGVRNELRRAGAVGVGFNSNEYIMPKAGNEEKVLLAVLNRIKSISKDLENLKTLALYGGVSLHPSDISEKSKITEAMLTVMLYLDCYNAIADNYGNETAVVDYVYEKMDLKKFLKILKLKMRDIKC